MIYNFNFQTSKEKIKQNQINFIVITYLFKIIIYV